MHMISMAAALVLESENTQSFLKMSAVWCYNVANGKSIHVSSNICLYYRDTLSVIDVPDVIQYALVCMFMAACMPAGILVYLCLYV